MKERLLTAAGPILGLSIFSLAVWIIHRELTHVELRDVLSHLDAIPRDRLVLAFCLTVLGYLTLTGYDVLACRYAQVRLPYRRLALASFIGYVFSHNVGVSFLGGGAVRYRMLSVWGITPGDIARIIAFNVLTFWLGFLALAGVALTISPAHLPRALGLPGSSGALLGIGLLLVLAAYTSVTTMRATPFHVRGFDFRSPRWPMTGAQIVVSSVDWTLAAAVLYVLLPPTPDLSFVEFLAVYLLAQIAGLASHVPAGLGVFETMLVLMLAPVLPGPVVLASVLAYRIVYYLLPMGFAVGLFGVYEALQHRRILRRVHDALESWMPAVVPRAITASTVAAGMLLLLSGATPGMPGRLQTLSRVLPLPIIEVSHFAGSLIGVVLLLLARALQRRLDAAYFLTLSLLGAGSASALLKGLDYEEALILAVMFLMFLPCRTYFYRRSSLLAQPFSAAWLTGIASIMVGTGFVTALAYRHVEYAPDLWWQFELSAHAPRSLRALVGACGALVVYWVLRLLRPVPPAAEPAASLDLERARAAIATSPRTIAHLVLLGDKRVLWDEDGSAFVMYGIEKRSWVAMGDPVGPAERRREIAWRFRELADRHGGWTVFYEAGAADLPVYLDLGLSLHKLGEEGRVPLDDFSLTGGVRKGLRQSLHRMERLGCRFEVVPPAGVPPLLDELQVISDAWLANKHTREKRFSLGFFDRRYLSQLPLAVVRRAERMVAFANVWAGISREEMSIDLMRYGDDAPPGVMEYLFAELMLWGKAQGYHWFSLGMAPLSGFQHHPLAPLWNRLGAFLFRHGGHFYSFEGLRAFKDKFEPVWEARYLASPGGLVVPMVLTHVAALISGGLGGVVKR